MLKKRCRRLAALALVFALLAGCAGTSPEGGGSSQDTAEYAAAFREKAEALRPVVLADSVLAEMEASPAGEDAGYVVFLSVCGGTERAAVRHGTGETPEAAWEAAAVAAEEAVKAGGPAPLWVKADLVYVSAELSAEALSNIGEVFGPGNFRYGLAFDSGYKTALLEAELNSAGIYDYENGGLNLERLNAYLEGAGSEPLSALPGEYIAFHSAGWFIDEEGSIVQLSPEEPGYGRRELGAVTGDTAGALVLDAAEYLAGRVQEDGAILGGDGASLGLSGAAEAVSALVRGYRRNPTEEMGAKLNKAVETLTGQIAFAEDDLAFLPENDEITLGGNALAALALADCIEASGSDAALPACKALGAGILSLLNSETGELTHVLNAADLSKKEAFRDPAWNGMAVSALSRLYGLTEDTLWLWAARQAFDYMAANEFAQYGEAWTSAAVRDLTKYAPDQTDCYALALQNAQRNLSAIYADETLDPNGFELLTATYQAYRQMIDSGCTVEGYEQELTLRVLKNRAVRLLDNYVFPEFAMYLEEPKAVLGAFMNRAEGLRVTDEALCASIRAYDMYAESYAALAADGIETVEAD